MSTPARTKTDARYLGWADARLGRAYRPQQVPARHRWVYIHWYYECRITFASKLPRARTGKGK